MQNNDNIILVDWFAFTVHNFMTLDQVTEFLVNQNQVPVNDDDDYELPVDLINNILVDQVKNFLGLGGVCSWIEMCGHYGYKYAIFYGGIWGNTDLIFPKSKNML